MQFDILPASFLLLQCSVFYLQDIYRKLEKIENSIIF